MNSEDPECKWLDSDECVTCEICLQLLVLDIPDRLKRLKRGHFGVLSKKQQKFHLSSAMRLHEKSPLHIWCAKKVIEIKVSKEKSEKSNQEAVKLLATNAALCLKTFGSAVDFVRLNDKDNMTEGVTPAFKNDGSQELFSCRESFFLHLGESVKKLFRDSVGAFSVTLDKLTVQHVSYSVIASYFFCVVC